MQLFQLNPNESDNSNVTTITLKTTTLFCQRGHVTKFHFKVFMSKKTQNNTACILSTNYTKVSFQDWRIKN